MKRILSLILIFIIVQVFGQASLEGTVKNVNNERVPFVSIFLKASQLGTSCDENGSFKINDIPSGNYSIVASAVGYHKALLQIDIKDDVNIANFVIKANTQLDEVELFGSRKNELKNWKL